jgi:ribonuclease HI
VAVSSREYLVYADGSCIGNPGPGGWGVVVRDPDGIMTELNGHDPSTTNNRMELMGAIEGLRATEPGADVLLKSDSRYVVNSMTLHYKRNTNHDLWKMLDAETAARRVRFEWVRAHATDATNNRADELALMGANGRLIAEGSSSEKRKTPSRAGDSKRSDAAVEAELIARLKLGEELRDCAGCGAKFVSRRDDDSFCSRARCQLQARSR